MSRQMNAKNSGPETCWKILNDSIEDFIPSATISTLFLIDGPGLGKTTAILNNVDKMKNVVLLFETHISKSEKYKELTDYAENVGGNAIVFEDFKTVIKQHTSIPEEKKSQILEELNSFEIVGNMKEKNKKINSILVDLFENEIYGFSKKDKTPEENDIPLDYVKDFLYKDFVLFEKCMYNDNDKNVFMTFDKILNNPNVKIDSIKNKTFIIDEDITEKLLTTTTCTQTFYVACWANGTKMLSYFPSEIRSKMKTIAKKITERKVCVMSDFYRFTESEYEMLIDGIYKNKAISSLYSKEYVYNEFLFLMSDVIYFNDDIINGVTIKKLPSVQNGNRYIVASADMDTFNRKILLNSINEEYQNTIICMAKSKKFMPKVYQIFNNSSKKNMGFSSQEELSDTLCTIDKTFLDDSKEKNIITHTQYIGKFRETKNVKTKYLNILNAKGTNTCKDEYIVVYGTPVKPTAYYLKYYAIAAVISPQTFPKNVLIEEISLKKINNERLPFDGRTYYRRQYEFINEDMNKLLKRDVCNTLSQCFGRQRQNLNTESKKAIVYIGQFDISTVSSIVQLCTVKELRKQ